MTLLQVSDLTVHAGPVPLVRGVSFAVERGERVGVIGESGSGKTLTALALLGLLDEGLRAGGGARLDGVPFDLLGAATASCRRSAGESPAWSSRSR
ncbi:ATP-binding cassette domain-containing protein [Streptomyces stramineus]